MGSQELGMRILPAGRGRARLLLAAALWAAGLWAALAAGQWGAAVAQTAVVTTRPAGAATTQPTAAGAAASEAAEARRYFVIVAKLASPEAEGRGPGTKGLEIARDFLVEQLRAAGLRPAFGNSYTQELRVPTGAKIESQELAIAGVSPATQATQAAQAAQVAGEDTRGPNGFAKPQAAPQRTEPRGDRRPGVSLTAGKDFQAMGMSAGKAFAGEAAFVGYSAVDPGHAYDSYAGAGKDDLKGKVAVVLRYEPADANGVSRWTHQRGSWTACSGLTTKVVLAERRGAEAVIIVNPEGNDNGKLDAPDRTAFGGRAKVPVLHVTRQVWLRILQAPGRDAATAAAAAKLFRSAADDGHSRITPLGVELRGLVKVVQTDTAIQNVAGLVPGAGPLAKEFIVVGGHYDHIGYGAFASRSRAAAGKIHPGADDNASGAAGVMTLARWMARRAEAGGTGGKEGEAGTPGSAVPGLSKTGPGAGAATPATDAPTNRRSIVFVAFSGEELGLLGSRYFVGHLGDLGIRPEQVVEMLNLDMIGRLRKSQLAVWGVDSGDRWRSIVDAAAKGRGFSLQLSGSGFGPSDQSTFYGAKIPVLCLHTGMHADLHMPTDTADKIDAAGAVRVLRMGEAVLSILWTEAEKIAYAPPQQGSRGAFLGISFDNDHEGGGCKVQSVVPGGPAATAGVEDGDVVVKWDGKDVPDSAALMVFVQHGHPDDKVRLTIQRGKDTKEIPVKLGGR
jgi:hypothetical protein